MQLVVIVFIDYIWINVDNPATPGNIGGGERRQEGCAGEAESQLHVAWRWALCAVLASFVAFGGLLFSMTDTYILINSKPGLCEKQLRDWLVTQLMWADNGRLGMMRMVRIPYLAHVRPSPEPTMHARMS
jgi:hypothetical protein